MPTMLAGRSGGGVLLVTSEALARTNASCAGNSVRVDVVDADLSKYFNVVPPGPLQPVRPAARGCVDERGSA
jgi:hypothetical protein